ncbi:thioredoxin domain-containing protein [Propionicimonas sp.]|uniref:thioredoxin domain-containing protein n=1 Tax=Propionicimonas sp. TaxID=1955623 RepID=UPI0039E3C647
MNRLAEATSPYLRMHADNPIEWWEWGPEALAHAQASQRPILLSVGYAACHWCHVMAHESFSDAAVAAIVNPNFVAIKVDREERPDIDALYLKATQALTGSGGWPNTVFLTPDGRPFFAGTYYPPVPSGGMPSFTQVLEAIDAAWKERREEADASASAITEHLAGAFAPPVAQGGRLDVWAVLDEVSREFDPIHGGFGTAPKFPAPLLVDALLVKGEPGSLDVAQRTLDAMARGGIHDQVGGGFARYSVDAGWVVPHFEKMLYDNALLLGAYTRGWRRVPDHDPLLRAQFERAVRGIVGWLERELRLPSGGFSASLDADSLDAHGRQHEGIYYCWSPELLADALGEEDGAWAAEVFHVTTAGTFEHGLSTLQLRGNPDPERLASISGRLLAERRQRFAPARDDKVVAAWNGWAIDSLVWAAEVFGEPAWLELARDASECLWRDHWDGRLHRSSLAGVASPVVGFAEDYGAVALGFARLAGALGDAEWLRRAEQLLDQARELFDADDGGFHDAATDAEQLWARARDVSDNPTPSGTSALIAALRLVALLAERPELDARASAAAESLVGILEQAPRFAGSALVDALVSDEARTGLRPAVAVVVDDDPIGERARATWRMAPIGTAILTGAAGTQGFAHHFDDRPGPDVYVCRGTTCFAPTSDLAELRAALWSRV